MTPTAPIFISYSHKDEAYVRTLAQRLTAAGLQPWYFTEHQPAGVHWAQRLRDVIAQARAVLVVISAASNHPEAEYVLAEVMMAQRERKPIIPLKIDPEPGPLDLMLAARNWINAWDGSDPTARISAAVAGRDALLTPADAYAQLTVAPAFQAAVNQRTFGLELPVGAYLLAADAATTLCRIGRDPRNDLVFSGETVFVSRRHATVTAQVTSTGVQFLIADEQSRHGTFVNGARIIAPQRLHDGDGIGLGTAQMMITFTQLEMTGAAPDDQGE